MLIKCQLCGKEFNARRKTRRFCSKLCISRNWNPPKEKRNPVLVECKYCGQKFKQRLYKSSISAGHKGLFCSRDCMVAHMKNAAFNFPCKICGKKIFTQPAQLKYRARSTCSLECRRKLARKRAEERRIKFGYTQHQLDRLARYSREAIEWRKKIFKRDNYTCQICGIRGTYLEADHIKPFAYFPELRYELSNGRTLCRKCHDKTKISAVKMRKLYGSAR